jgi:hypothetical protein
MNATKIAKAIATLKEVKHVVKLTNVIKVMYNNVAFYLQTDGITIGPWLHKAEQFKNKDAADEYILHHYPMGQTNDGCRLSSDIVLM